MKELHYSPEHIHLPQHHLSLRVLKTISKTGSTVTLLVSLLFFICWLFQITPFTNILGKNLFNLINLTIFIFVILSLTTNFIKIPFRFHYTQLFAFIAVSLSLFILLENIYRYVSKIHTEDMISVIISSMIFILCQSLLFAKPDRGLVGLFTTDSLSSQLARRSLSFIILSIPTVGFLILIGENMQLFNVSERIAVFITILMLLSATITYVNVKFLYHSEVENFLMKEALRINNITLEINANDLSTQIVQLEKNKKEIANKLNHQESLSDIIDRME